MGLPKNKVKIGWSPEFAYAIGLLVTDGSLSKDGRHINFTSKDLDLIETFKKCLHLENKVGTKTGYRRIKNIFQIQFGDVNFYRFLLSIGLMPNKTKILKKIAIPEEYFFDFLRGHFDGDGSFNSYWDPRWKSSFMFYMNFVSASENHIKWLRNGIFETLQIRGHVSKARLSSCYQLRYAKKESLKLLDKLYYRKVVCLHRKYLKIRDALFIISKLLKKSNARVV